MATKFRALNGEEKATQKSALGKAARYINAKAPLSEAQLQTLYNKLRTSTYEADVVNGLGVAMGDIIIKKTGYQWVHLTYDEGYEVCVVAPGNKVLCAPLSIVTKHLYAGDDIQFSDLISATIATMQQRASKKN